jgi:hypothetical protein
MVRARSQKGVGVRRADARRANGAQMISAHALPESGVCKQTRKYGYE